MVCTIGTLNLDLAIKTILKKLFGILKMPHLLFNYKNNNEIKIYFFNLKKISKLLLKKKKKQILLFLEDHEELKT